jgi:hypothetical protein
MAPYLIAAGTTDASQRYGTNESHVLICSNIVLQKFVALYSYNVENKHQTAHTCAPSNRRG